MTPGTGVNGGLHFCYKGGGFLVFGDNPRFEAEEGKFGAHGEGVGVGFHCVGPGDGFVVNGVILGVFHYI